MGPRAHDGRSATPQCNSVEVTRGALWVCHACFGYSPEAGATLNMWWIKGVHGEGASAGPW